MFKQILNAKIRFLWLLEFLKNLLNSSTAGPFGRYRDKLLRGEASGPVSNHVKNHQKNWAGRFFVATRTM